MIEDLSQLRESIDVLDNEILKALARRMELSDRIIAAKNGSAAFRPGREAALVRQLVAKVKQMGLILPPRLFSACGGKLWRPVLAARMVNWPVGCITTLCQQLHGTWEVLFQHLSMTILPVN